MVCVELSRRLYRRTSQLAAPNSASTWRHAPQVTVDDPWGHANSLEWATSCPPPRHNFITLPRVRSERPAFDLHHPEVAALDHAEPEPALMGGELDSKEGKNR